MSDKAVVLQEIANIIENVRYESNMAEGTASGLDGISDFDPEEITLDDVENFQSIADELRTYAENVESYLDSLVESIEMRDEEDEGDE